MIPGVVLLVLNLRCIASRLRVLHSVALKSVKNTGNMHKYAFHTSLRVSTYAMVYWPYGNGVLGR